MKSICNKAGFSFLITSVILVFNSCNIKGLGIGYKKLSQKERKLVNKNTSLAPPLYNDTIYLYKSEVLKSFLKNIPHTLIYVWSANCSSKSCISLKACQQYANENGLFLLVLQEYFDPSTNILDQQPSNALIMADFNFYSKTFADKNTRLFLEDLIDSKNLVKSDLDKRYFFFKNDQFLYSKEEILNPIPSIMMKP